MLPIAVPSAPVSLLMPLTTLTPSRPLCQQHQNIHEAKPDASQGIKSRPCLSSQAPGLCTGHCQQKGTHQQGGGNNILVRGIGVEASTATSGVNTDFDRLACAKSGSEP
ncbi:hypothetical protein N7468_005186 [Penicillium chermesinum]|uniref:Uncharacterized protein n=1 Tax=Penicillium chermesinum TaxID=63820 RepID=A0A9W9NZC5_9EURO|nr:uncharacterized protein N7468_005186 [Penicillium chermesinum]KAJ5232230.1 hypothetical protein N7468_005186 [Penicillium chermesinum]KAJ6171889.1 hypothetical protein N7470_000956 [Penicillium chermesinum]